MWSFPFKLLVKYKGRIITLKTLQQAREFELGLEEEEIEVEVLNWII